MSTLHAYRKNVAKNTMKFLPDMYNNICGSLVITAYMLSDEKPEVKDIRKTWLKLKKKGLDYWLDDPHFCDKLLSNFNMKAPYGRMAFCQSQFNCLFLPYIDGVLLPIREDGIPSLTQTHGKIYPVNEPKEEEA